MATSINKPFVFGVRVMGENFTDRVEETKRLSDNFRHGINTILISPRRMGKTSLVDKVCSVFNDEDNIRIARMDAFPCRNEIDFATAFASAIIKATSSKWAELVANARTFLTKLVPKISFSPDPLNEFSLSFDINPSLDYSDEVYNLAERIATEKGYRIVVCIDEFQQVGEFSRSLSFQKKLRSAWQMHSNVTYCLYGSKKHLMETMFQSKSNPFYRFGDLMYLGKISEDNWVEFICKRFEHTGKKISEDFSRSICKATDCYSSYVQQLAWMVWLNTENEVKEADIERGIDNLLDSCEPLFIQQTEGLSDYQMNFLKAVADGISNGFSHKNVLTKYRLGTSANVARVKKALTEKDLIATTSPNHIEMCDPILSLWLKRRILF